MGTSILANLLALHSRGLPGGAYLAMAALALSWLLLAGLTVTFLVRCVKNPRVLRESLTQGATIPFWSTVSIGILSAGAALAVVLPLFFPEWEGFAWQVDSITWIIATSLGIPAALGSGAYYIGNPNPPSFVWGLGVMAPMVAATVGANLSTHIDPVYGPMLLIIAAGCFFLTLTLGSVIFIRAYVHIWGSHPLPLAMSASSWIPLGLVGQSSASSQAIAHSLEAYASGPIVASTHLLANVYGLVMWVIGLPLVVWASVVTLRGFYYRMPFSPGWWTTTFPIGTLSLGATWMAKGLETPLLDAVGLVGTLVLCGTVTLSLWGSIRAVMRRSGT